MTPSWGTVLNNSLKDFFEKNVKSHYQTQNFDFGISGEDIELEIDRDRIEPLVSNLVDNAKQHGKATKIIFDFQYTDDTKEYVRIICKNNGFPFHVNFNFEENKENIEVNYNDNGKFLH